MTTLDKVAAGLIDQHPLQRHSLIVDRASISAHAYPEHTNKAPARRRQSRQASPRIRCPRYCIAGTARLAV